ncbi:MAG: hypothetical protein M3138_02525 [Actinomycetota bacterium]|nr:hypothetical protein [Actinomycetota bacterium]
MSDTVPDILESLLRRSPGLTPGQLHEGLGTAKQKVPVGWVAAILRTYPQRFAQFGGRWYRSSIEAGDALGVERDLQERLVGRRIVAEIGLDSSLHRRNEEAMRLLIRSSASVGSVARRYPALFVAYMAGHGVHGYTAGDFYGAVSVRGIDQRAGPLFVEALKALQLETFEDLVLGDNALRYVGPMLAHGGIPKYCLSDFFDLLLRDANKAGGDARELLGFWRSRKSAFFGIDIPVRRFLLFGGELARDLLDRCLDLVRAFELTGTVAEPVVAGLPPYIVQAFRDRPGRPAPGPRSERSTFPRPTIRVDPWDPSGLVLSLPPVNAASGASWRLQADGQLERFPTSAFESRQIRLRPAKSWGVLLESGEESLDLTFEGLDDIPALLFEPATGRLLPAGAGLRADEVWVLTPGEVRVDGIKSDGTRVTIDEVQELPELTGDWSGFVLRHLSLGGLRALSLVDRSLRERRVSVRPGAERPRLVGTPVPGVTTAEGEDVYSSLPAVELPVVGAFPPSAWQARVGVDGTWHSVEVDNDGLIDLTGLLGRVCAAVNLVVQGPLGSDLRTRFALAPGLRVERPDRLLFPQDPDAAVRVQSEVVGIDDGKPGETVILRLPAETDVLRCRAGKLALEIQVPKVLWGVARASVPDLRMSDVVALLAEDDVVGGDAFALVVRCGQADVPLGLSLTAKGHTVQRSEDARSSGPDGRWAFDLKRFADSVRLSDAPSLSLVLQVGHRPLTVARLRPSLHVTRLECTSQVVGDHTVVDLNFDEERQHRNRVARLWSLERPWEGPIEATIPDGQVGSARFSRDDLPPGTYLAEVAIDDGWTPACRPLRLRPGVARIRVGTPEEARNRVLGLPLHDVLAVLESALITGRLPRRVQADELPMVLPAALHAVKVVLAGPGTPDLTARQLWAVAPLLCADPSCLAVAATSAAESGLLGSTDLLLLTLALGSGLAPAPEGAIQEATIRGLWEVAPAMAAALDLSSKPDEAAAARAREFLGWDPSDGAETISTGAPVTQHFVGMGDDQLRAIQRSSELVPGRLLELDAWVLANFEWLLAHKAKTGDPEAWWREAARLVDHLTAPAAILVAHLDAREPPPGTEPWAALPQATLAAAMHIFFDSSAVPEARRALAEAVAFAPRLVTHDLVLARALTLDPLFSEVEE